jgi:hypothetical protein
MCCAAFERDRDDTDADRTDHRSERRNWTNRVASGDYSSSKLTRRVRRALARFNAVAVRDRYSCRLMRDG